MAGAEVRVAGVVLAAGSSRRMGRNKLLLEIEGEAMVRRAVRRTIESGAHPVIVVLGHQAERVEAELRGLACALVLNPAHAEGQRTSLQAGIARVSDADAAVVVLADMPFVTSEMVSAVRTRHLESGSPLVVSRYGQVDAPPTLYHCSLFPELLALEGPGGGKLVARRHAGQATVVEWPEAALEDVDAAEDYERLGSP
jgi:molybdenum cofactor cytidylyltransferase